MSIESTFWGEPIIFEFNSLVSFWIEWSKSLLVVILYDSYNVGYQANKCVIAGKYVCTVPLNRISYSIKDSN